MSQARNDVCDRIIIVSLCRSTLLTIEGERDEISGHGQTEAAHDLCRRIAARDKRHVTARQCGHYDLFSGPRWRTEVYPRIRALTMQDG